MPRFLSDPVFDFHGKLMAYLTSKPEQENGLRVLIDPYSDGLALRALSSSKCCKLAVSGHWCEIQFGYDAFGNLDTQRYPTADIERIGDRVISFFDKSALSPVPFVLDGRDGIDALDGVDPVATTVLARGSQ